MPFDLQMAWGSFKKRGTREILDIHLWLGRHSVEIYDGLGITIITGMGKNRRVDDRILCV
jgi:hypothetical protein